jgi:hypothetical protein
LTGHPRRTWTYDGVDPDATDDEKEAPGERSSLFHRTISLLTTGKNTVEAAAASNGVFWPETVLKDDFPKARILVYGYDSEMRHRLQTPTNQSTILDYGQNFLTRLEAQGRGVESRPIIFVAHSLGGIIVKEALRRSEGHRVFQTEYHRIYERTKAIIFMGTPHRGANPQSMIRTVVESVLRGVGYQVNENLVSGLLPTSERLKEVREEFMKLQDIRDWRVVSFVEEYGMRRLSGEKV